MPIDQQSTVFRQFTAAVEHFGSRPFLRAPAVATKAYADKALGYTYSEALDAVNRLRRVYQFHEVRLGDRVAAAFDSRLDVYLHLLALNAVGASLVPLNLAATDSEIDYVLSHSDARLVVGAGEYAARLSARVDAVNEARRGQAASRPEDLRLVDFSLSITTGQLAEPQGGRLAEAALLYTSGTTGKPKGCMLSNDYFITMGVEYNRMGGLCAIDENDRLITPLPPNHMNALTTSFMAMMMCGGCVIQLDRFHPRSWWQTVRDERATVVHYLGVMPAILLTLEKNPDDHLAGQVRFGFGAGSDPRHQQVFEERFGFPLIEAWAMTETGGACMIVARTEPRHLGQRCIGTPMPGMELRLVDESDQDVTTGADGELLVRRAGDDTRQGFFSGYYKDEAATEQGWKGGWWHTGDVVRQDQQGYLYFVDRRKNVIRRSGENIAAVEVEAALLQLDEVANCAVTAVPDEMRGDEVFAFVVPAASGPLYDADTSSQWAEKLFRHCLQCLSYFKAPGYIAWVKELPLTASQKVSRAEVKKQALDYLQRGAAVNLCAEKRRPAS